MPLGSAPEPAKAASLQDGPEEGRRGVGEGLQVASSGWRVAPFEVEVVAQQRDGAHDDVRLLEVLD